MTGCSRGHRQDTPNPCLRHGYSKWARLAESCYSDTDHRFCFQTYHPPCSLISIIKILNSTAAGTSKADITMGQPRDRARDQDFAKFLDRDKDTSTYHDEQSDQDHLPGITPGHLFAIDLYNWPPNRRTVWVTLQPWIRILSDTATTIWQATNPTPEPPA